MWKKSTFYKNEVKQLKRKIWNFTRLKLEKIKKMHNDKVLQSWKKSIRITWCNCEKKIKTFTRTKVVTSGEKV